MIKAYFLIFFLTIGTLSFAQSSNDWQLFPQGQVSFWKITKADGTQTYDIYYNDSTEVLAGGAKRHYFGKKYYNSNLGICADSIYRQYFQGNVPFVIDEAVEDTDGSWQFGSISFNPTATNSSASVQNILGYTDSVKTYILPIGILKLSKTLGIIDFPFYGDSLISYGHERAQLIGFDKDGQHYGFTSSFWDYFGDFNAGYMYCYERISYGSFGSYISQRERETDSIVSAVKNQDTLILTYNYHRASSTLNFQPPNPPVPPIVTVTSGTETIFIHPHGYLQGNLLDNSFEKPKFFLSKDNSGFLKEIAYSYQPSSCFGGIALQCYINGKYVNPDCSTGFLYDYGGSYTLNRNLGRTYSYTSMSNQLIGYDKNGNTCGDLDWYAATPVESVENDMENFVLYPNPTYDRFYISNEKAIGELYELYDIHGRILQRNIYTQEGINVSEYPAGVYFCRVRGEVIRLVKAN